MQIVVDGILTNYQIIGGNNKPKLIILHGWKRSLGEWLPTAKELSVRYQIILIDLPGFGKTAMPNSTYSIYDYAIFVEHFLDKLGIKKITLMGHSFGGRIGIIFGAKTKKLEKLILVDAAGVEKRSPVARIKIFVFKLAKLFLPKNIIESLRNRLGSLDYKSAGSMRNIFLKVINEDLSYLLSQINVPTILIWGERDKEIALWKIKKMKNEIPYAKLRVVWGTGHDPHLEKPNEFMEILKEELNA